MPVRVLALAVLAMTATLRRWRAHADEERSPQAQGVQSDPGSSSIAARLREVGWYEVERSWRQWATQQERNAAERAHKGRERARLRPDAWVQKP